VVPLWAEHIGLDAAQTSLVFAAAALVEVVLFWPAGTVMDRHGRVWVAVPVALLLGGGLLVLPATTTLAGVAVVALVMGVGNGIGSGIVMTLGADAAPVAGRAPFLGVWRLLSLVGTNGAALVVAGVAAVASIAAASVVVGLLTLLGGAWLARWLPEYDPRRGGGAT
jgi:MFS family permease